MNLRLYSKIYDSNSERNKWVFSSSFFSYCKQKELVSIVVVYNGYCLIKKESFIW